MREILFRGKRVDNGEWVYGGYSKHQKSGKIFIRPYVLSCIHSQEVIPETVGQYTGLTDRNGKRIFGGDIIKAADASPEYSLVVIRDEGYGFFNDYYFGGEWYDTEPICGVDWFLCDEIIGNIHDNPELLEVEK